MGRLAQTWRAWTARTRVLALAGVAIVGAGLGVLAYEVLKRPPDVTNDDVAFVEREQKKPKTKPKDTTFDWPTYGFNDARTRFVPSNKIKPPYHSSDWSFQAGKLLEFSPIIVGERVYFMDIDARFYAINTPKGKVAWQKRIGTLNASAPAYANHRLFGVNMEPAHAFALRPRDGKLLWKTPLPGRSESSPLAFRDDLVIFGCECGTVLALDQKTGKIEWQVETSGEIKGALAQGKDNVYGGNYAGEVFAIDADTGREEWRVDTIGGSFGRGGGVYSTPAVAFGRVYLGSIDSRVYSLDMDTGEIAWSKSTGAEVYSGPVVADTKGTRATVYIGSADDNFYALDAKTGETRWQQDTGGDVTGAGSVIGDVAYVSVIGDAIGTIGYDIESGEKVWSHELGEYNPAITDGDRLYLTGYSTLRAFTPDDGKDKGGKKGKRKGGKQREDGAANTDKKNNKKQKPKQQKRQRQQKNR